MRSKLPKTKKAQIFVPLLLLAIISLVLFLLNLQPKQTFADTVTNCNSNAVNLRFSCYRNAIEKYFGRDAAKFSQIIKNDKQLSFETRFAKDGKITYAIFGTNCHTFYHAAGDYMATYAQSQDLKALLAMGSGSCTAGYTMGVYKRFALKNHYSDDVLKKLIEVCPDGQQNQCAHELGHALHDKYTYALLKVLDGVSKDKYNLAAPEPYQYVTYPDKKADLNAPFAQCEAIIPKDKPNLVSQCFTGIGHNMFIFSEFSPNGYSSQFKDCENVVANRDNCYAFLIYRIGINEGATRFLSNDSLGGNRVCDEAINLIKREDLKYHCYLGVGGGIGLWIDSEYSPATIGSDNLVRVKEQLNNYAHLCEKVPDQFQDRCFAGLMGTKFAKYYKDLGIYYDRIEKIIPQLDTGFQVVG